MLRGRLKLVWEQDPLQLRHSYPKNRNLEYACSECVVREPNITGHLVLGSVRALLIHMVNGTLCRNLVEVDFCCVASSRHAIPSLASLISLDLAAATLSLATVFKASRIEHEGLPAPRKTRAHGPCCIDLWRFLVENQCGRHSQWHCHRSLR